MEEDFLDILDLAYLEGQTYGVGTELAWLLLEQDRMSRGRRSGHSLSSKSVIPEAAKKTQELIATCDANGKDSWLVTKSYSEYRRPKGIGCRALRPEGIRAFVSSCYE